MVRMLVKEVLGADRVLVASLSQQSLRSNLSGASSNFPGATRELPRSLLPEPPPDPPRSRPIPRESVVYCSHADRTFSRPADVRSCVHAVCGRVALAGFARCCVGCRRHQELPRSLPGVSQESSRSFLGACVRITCLCICAISACIKLYFSVAALANSFLQSELVCIFVRH